MWWNRIFKNGFARASVSRSRVRDPRAIIGSRGSGPSQSTAKGPYTRSDTKPGVDQHRPQERRWGRFIILFYFYFLKPQQKVQTYVNMNKKKHLECLPNYRRMQIRLHTIFKLSFFFVYLTFFSIVFWSQWRFTVRHIECILCHYLENY